MSGVEEKYWLLFQFKLKRKEERKKWKNQNEFLNFEWAAHIKKSFQLHITF